MKDDAHVLTQLMPLGQLLLLVHPSMKIAGPVGGRDTTQTGVVSIEVRQEHGRPFELVPHWVGEPAQFQPLLHAGDVANARAPRLVTAGAAHIAAAAPAVPAIMVRRDSRRLVTDVSSGWSTFSRSSDTLTPHR